MNAFPDNPYSQQNIMMHQLYGAPAINMNPNDMYAQNVYFGSAQQPQQDYYDTALAQTYFQPQSYLDPTAMYQQQQMINEPYSSQQQLYEMQALLQQQQQLQQLQQPSLTSQRQQPQQQQYLSIIDRMHDDTKQNPHDLQLLETLEHRLATVLADPNATTADQANVMKIYSEVINNAEAASRNISAQDPHKKLWYRRVLEYQIKEKKFREQLAKQQQIKLDMQQEAAEKAKVEAEKQKEIDANNKIMEQKLELDKYNAEQLALHQAQQNGNPQQQTNLNQQNSGETLNLQQPAGGLTFYPGQSQQHENYNLQAPNYGVGTNGGGQGNYQQLNGDFNSNQMNQQQQQNNFGQTSNFAGANDYYQQQTFQTQPPQYDPYQQQTHQQNQLYLQNLMAEQSKQFFSALTDMITTTIDNTHQQQLELQYSVRVSDDPNDPKYSDPLAYHSQPKDTENRGGNGNGGDRSYGERRGGGGGDMMGYGGRGPEKYSHDYNNNNQEDQEGRPKHEYLKRAQSPPIPTIMNRNQRVQENDISQENQEQGPKHEYLRRAQSPPIPTLMKGQNHDYSQGNGQAQQPKHQYLHRANGNQSDLQHQSQGFAPHNNQSPQRNNHSNSPPEHFNKNNNNLGSSPNQQNYSNNYQQDERRPYSPPIPTHQNDRQQQSPHQNNKIQQPLDRKSTDITANNKSLPGYSKFEQYNGAPVTGRSGMLNLPGNVGNSYPPPGGTLNSSRQQNAFFKHEQTFVGPGAADLNAKREQMYQNKGSFNQMSGDLPQSANASNIHSLPGNSKWEKVPTGVPKSYQDAKEIAEEEFEDEEHHIDVQKQSPTGIEQQHDKQKFQKKHNPKQGYVNKQFQHHEDDYSQQKGQDPYFQGKDISTGRPGHLSKLSPQEPNDMFFDDGVMPSEIGHRDQTERLQNDRTGPGHNFQRDNLLHPMTKVLTQKQGEPSSPQLSIDLSNTEILNDEERKAQRREKIKQNHLKRLQTIENSQQQNLKRRAESPFLSQHNTFAKELADTTPRGTMMIGGPQNADVGLRKGNRQSLDTKGNKPLQYSDDRAISDINRNPQRNSNGNQMPNSDIYHQGPADKRASSEDIVNTGGDSRNRRGLQPGGTGSARPNFIAEAQNSQTDLRNNNNTSSQGNSRQPRQSRQKPGLPPRDLKSLKALSSLPAPIQPTEITLPPELGNDAEIKKQLAEIAEKQMKMITNYKHDIERIAQEKASENQDLLSNAGSIADAQKKNAEQDASSFLKSIKGSDRKNEAAPPNWKNYEEKKGRGASEMVHGKDKGHQNNPTQNLKESVSQTRPWATGADSKAHTQVRNQGEDKGTNEQRLHPLRSSSLQEDNTNYQDNHNERQHNQHRQNSNQHNRDDNLPKKDQRPRLHPTRTLSQNGHRSNSFAGLSPIDNDDNHYSVPTEDIPPYSHNRDQSNNRNSTNRVHQQSKRDNNQQDDQQPRYQNKNKASSHSRHDQQDSPHYKESYQGHQQSTRRDQEEGRSIKHKRAAAEQRDDRHHRAHEQEHKSSRNQGENHRQHSMPERKSGEQQSNGSHGRGSQDQYERHSKQARHASDHNTKSKEDKKIINPIIKHTKSVEQEARSVAGVKDITHRYLHQTHQEPIHMGKLLPGKSISNILVNHAEQLFVIEPQPYLERPVDKFKQKYLADDDMKGLHEFDEVMRQNVDYERQVFKDLLWKNFDLWSENQKIDHLYALIEQYFYQVLTNDFHKIQVPVFMQGEITRKLKSLAFQLYQTDAYILMQTSQTQEALFNKIEEAMDEVGLVNMHNFIQQELRSQIKLSRKAYPDGSVVQACGALPRSLQPMIEDIKEKVELDYHNEKMQQDQFDIHYEHRPKKYGVPIYQDPLENSENRSQVLERQPSIQSDNPYDMASPSKKIVKNQDKIINQGAFHNKIVYPEEIDLIKLYGEKYKQNEVNLIRNVDSQEENNGNHYRSMKHQHPQEYQESPAYQSPYQIQNPFSPSQEDQPSNQPSQQFSQDFQLNSALIPLAHSSPTASQISQSPQLINMQPVPSAMMTQTFNGMNQLKSNLVNRQIGATLVKQSVQNAWQIIKQSSQQASPIREQLATGPIIQDFSQEAIDNIEKRRKSIFDMQKQQLNQLTPIVEQDEGVTKRSSVRHHQIQSYAPESSKPGQTLPDIEMRRKSQFQQFIQIHEFQGGTSHKQQNNPLTMDQYKNTFNSQINNLQTLTLPPINNQDNQVSLQDKKLGLAVQKHLDAINKATQDQSPYEQFVTQFFNQIKDETHQRYYRSKEEIYKQYNFNEAPTLDHLFKAKEETLKRDGVIKDPKPTTQTLFEKIKQLKNPFIDELFIDNNLTESEKQSDHYTDKQAQLTLQIAKYEQEFQQLRNELEELAKLAGPPQAAQQFEVPEVVRLPSINDYQYQPIVKQGSLIRSTHNEEKISSSKDLLQYNQLQQQPSLESRYRSSMEQPLTKYESMKELVKTSDEHRGGFQSSIDINQNVAIPQLEIVRSDSGKVTISKKKESFIVPSQKNSPIQYQKQASEINAALTIQDQIRPEQPIKQGTDNQSLDTFDLVWSDSKSPVMPKQPYASFLPSIQNSSRPGSLMNIRSPSDKLQSGVDNQLIQSASTFGGGQKFQGNKQPSMSQNIKSLTMESYESTFTLGDIENKQ